MEATEHSNEQTRSNAGQQPVEADQSSSAHITFPPVPDSEKASRHEMRKKWRAPLYQLPLGSLFEIPGRPHTCYCLRDYGHPMYGVKPNGAKLAREDFAFLFKAFESGQTPPHRLKKDQEHVPTIHQYLDWTVTGTPSSDVDDVDFGGFRCVLLFSRHKPEYPPPDTYESSTKVPPLDLGATRPPLPDLMTKGNKPVCAATIRIGNGYMEVPFFATADNHRGKGYGRCLLEAIEKISRALNIERLLLCSTDDDKVRGMWESCGFQYTGADHVERWDVRQGDLIYMTNTVQMHKFLPPARPFRPIVIQHGAFRARIHTPEDAAKGEGLAMFREAEMAAAARKRGTVPNKCPPKKVAKKV